MIADFDIPDRGEANRSGRSIRARRSSLSVPGSSERMLDKAVGLGADEIVVDLEDSVAPEAKEQARQRAAEFLARERPPSYAVAVRINALGGPWGKRDVTELVRRQGKRIDSLIVPKVERADDIAEVQQLLDSEGDRAAAVRLQALVETAAGLVHIAEIAEASERLESLILGYADLAASLGRASGPTASGNWLYAQETLLVSARASGLQAIDGPYLDIRDPAGLRLRAEHVRALGFDGKWAVHPDQLTIINAAFTPTPGEIAQARAVLDSLRYAKGRGAVELRGKMIDEASRKLALQIVARGRAASLEGAPR
jgi:citrate lyase subunit beta/citryl-CoA lyase